MLCTIHLKCTWNWLILLHKYFICKINIICYFIIPVINQNWAAHRWRSTDWGWQSSAVRPVPEPQVRLRKECLAAPLWRSLCLAAASRALLPVAVRTRMAGLAGTRIAAAQEVAAPCTRLVGRTVEGPACFEDIVAVAFVQFVLSWLLIMLFYLLSFQRFLKACWFWNKTKWASLITMVIFLQYYIIF